ncbi:MAG: ribonuclease H-like domain-containing protein [Anaerolineae bacterium]|nr:ribonuclease H-like domain-containing protein [Anaerolineae bacterium]
MARLRRLGVVKGTRHLRPVNRSSPSESVAPGRQQAARTVPDGEPQALPALLPGLELVATPEGACYVLDRVYPLQFRHGAAALDSLLQHRPAAAAPFCGEPRLRDLDFRDFLFVDTETTGLHGAGTLAFMVGVAFYEDDAFVSRQYFLRDHGDEPAMLWLLDQLLAERPALITFNGRSFDLPLLDGRFLLNRMPSDLLQRPHIDLLLPARRLWRQRLDSCALSALEQALLGLQRSQEDVPGWLIPSLYNDYLASGDGREMARVFYHNRIDLLSMVTLAARIVRQLAAPQPGDHPIDLFGLGRWLATLGRTAAAEEVLRLAAVPELPTPLYQQALAHLALLLKRAGRRDEAITVWQQLASTSFDDVTAHIELAKHYEWHGRDLETACFWTEQAIALLGPHDRTLHAELVHRHRRLIRKMGRD